MTPTQTRAARRLRRQRRRRFVKFGGTGAIALLAAVFILSLFAGGLRGGGSSGNVGPPPDGPGLRIEAQGREHIPQSMTHPAYNSVPATSGWHYGDASAPAKWGVYEDPLPDEVLVHNLEHGGIGIHYNCPDGCDELIDQLEGIANRAVKVILAPYPDMDTTIALTAWTFLDAFEEFDKDRVEDFVRAHESSPNAPEYNVP
jgi:hypothetical protein